MRLFVAAFGFMLALASATSSWAAAPSPILVHQFDTVAGGNTVNPIIGHQTGIDPSTWALYGITKSGGPGNAGVFYKLTPPAPGSTHWTQTRLYLFGSVPGDSNPVRSLVFDDTSGVVYGILANTLTRAPSSIFKLTPPPAGEYFWRKTTVYTFSTNDQGAPFSLLVDKSGTLYVDELNQYLTIPGTYGAIVKLTPPISGRGQWTPAILHNFIAADGQIPAVPPILDETGAIYGATNNANFNFRTSREVGVLYKLSLSGPRERWTYAQLYTFPYGGNEAEFPAFLVRNKTGIFFIFADAGPSSSVFRLEPPSQNRTNWIRTELTEFSIPRLYAGGLAIIDDTGSLYGTILRLQGARDYFTGYPFRLDAPVSGQGLWSVTRLADFGGSSESLNGEIIRSPGGQIFSSTSDHDSPGASVTFGGAVFRIATP